MTLATQLDLYQLTSLAVHLAAGRADDRVVMAFFSRSLPKDVCTGLPARGYLLSCGLGRGLDWLGEARFDEASLAALARHPALGPAMAQVPDMLPRLREWRFRGEIWAPPEGTPLFAGQPAVRPDGSSLDVDGVRPAAYCPYLVVETDLLSAKLIETPLLSRLNHMTMVASKAARVVEAAGARPVFEFGTRRTHPDAAVDAALAAWIGGVAASSNVAANVAFGVPISGTMDHFAVQAWEQPGVPHHETERAFFAAMHELYPGRDTLLVDTYDTFGEHTGIRNAVAAVPGGPFGIRMDSGITAESVRRARDLLDALGAKATKIVVSGGLDETAIAALAGAPADGFGIGERIVTSPDAPVGVGAVAKLVAVRGEPTMKLSRGTSKATLPGWIQCFRDAGGTDVIGLRDEAPPPGTTALLAPVWTWEAGRLPSPAWADVRAWAQRSIAALPPERKVPRIEGIRVTARLAALVDRLSSA